MRNLKIFLLITAAGFSCCTAGNLIWNLSGDGTLTVSDSGKMPDYDDQDNKAPWLMQETDITKVIINEGITNIGNHAFAHCSNLISVTVPNSVTSIGESAFSGCENLTSVTIPNSVKNIGESAFSGCENLTSITVPNSVTSIGKSVFFACSNLVSVTIPDSVTGIGDDTFSFCENLVSVTVPKSVTSIGHYAFSGCKKLSGITVFWETPVKTGRVFYEDEISSATLYVPAGTKLKYQQAAGWKEFKNIVEQKQ